jgi:hypothetical protein
MRKQEKDSQHEYLDDASGPRERRPAEEPTMKVAQVGDSSVIAVQGPGDNLVFYWQPIGGQQWNRELVAGAPLAASPPSVAQVGNSSVIAVQAPGNRLCSTGSPSAASSGTGRWWRPPRA